MEEDRKSRRQSRAKTSLKDGFVKTAIEYTQATSLHGVPYILEGGNNLLASKIFWLLVVTAAAGLGVHWSVEVSHLYPDHTHAIVYSLW